MSSVATKESSRAGWSLRAIALMVLASVAIPTGILLAWSSQRLTHAVQADSIEHARLMAENAARRHGELVAEARVLLTVLAHVPRFGTDAEYCTDLVQRLRAGATEFANVGVIGVDGRVRCSALPFEPGLDLSDRAYFRGALRSRGFAAGVYQVGRITGVPGINFGYPVPADDGAIAGVAFVSVSAQWLADLVGPLSLPRNTTLVLLDRSLNALMRYPAGADPAVAMPVSRTALAALIDHAPRGGSVPVGRDDAIDPSRQYVYLRLGADEIADAPYLLVGWPADTLAGSLTVIAHRQPWLVLAALVGLAAMTWWRVNRVLMDPIRGLSASASRLAAGEQGVRLSTDGRVRELVAVSAAFNHMAARVDGALRAYAVLSAGNRALLREADKQRLLQAMCEVAVEVGGYRCAWVAYLEDGALERMASAGDDGGFAEYLSDHWQMALAHGTPTAQAIATGQPVALTDADRPAAHPLFAEATRRGLRSGLVLPLTVDGQVIGVFTIYATQPDAFQVREQALLAEMADDLSFGIATARLRRREQEAAARLRQQALFDAVTGLANEAHFLDQASALCASGRTLAVLLVQLGNYWEIATTLGRDNGDLFLTDVARRLEALSPALLARVAQSEFAVLLTDTDDSAASHAANRALLALRAPAQLSRIGVDIAATIGVAVGGRRSNDAERLLQASKLAAHDAERRSQPVLLAHPDLDREWRERLTLAADLRVAIDTRQLRVYAQPQLDLRTGAICAMEALARWHRPPDGDVSPARFIGLAETTGLIRPLTYAILDGVWELATVHAGAGLALPIAVNVSARNLHDPEFVGRVSDLLLRWPLPLTCLHLELTETAVMQDPVHSLKVLQTLHGLGLSIYLDDFGTGYSSMAYLRELPLSGLKIDRAFTSGLAQPATRRIVQAMIDLGHALGLTVIAEGVEDEDTLATLAALGCDVAQGYCIARPMPGAGVAEWIARWRGLPRGDRPDDKLGAV